MRRFPWRSSRFERQALTAARCLELLPKTRFETDPAVRPVWAVIANSLATAMLEDLSPEFEGACWCAARAGTGPLYEIPLRGYIGWRRRARIAGYI